ncbi:hypothetical protein LCL89_14500 [Halobacillus yeomjeoni]|uniref:Uncharacterized protein n=1 Tax=Halobacillus yeomjeoni TaxID=311194 RepID=A0A931HVY8_9BACI|nr:hypothetical protein [Halobacillus yeomjeoni]MBH0230677.1 hypothetical protein [Halobacillus yeomjeoni]MCA0985240.1 hypothetical protein [Halobacillus yeomjeoni]
MNEPFGFVTNEEPFQSLYDFNGGIQWVYLASVLLFFIFLFLILLVIKERSKNQRLENEINELKKLNDCLLKTSKKHEESIRNNQKLKEKMRELHQRNEDLREGLEERKSLLRKTLIDYMIFKRQKEGNK